MAFLRRWTLTRQILLHTVAPKLRGPRDRPARTAVPEPPCFHGSPRANPALSPQMTGPGRTTGNGSAASVAGLHPRNRPGLRYPKLLSERILLEYSLGYECSADTAWPA